jgi:hypothetical protein
MRTLFKIITFFVLLAFTACGGTNNNADNTSLMIPDTGQANISFTEYEHNFGVVAAGEKVGYIFTFLNSGTGHLAINSVSTSCGCTIPKYDKKPIPPGGEGSLEVIFNTAGYDGVQSKTITVQSNAETPVVMLKIMAQIVNSN